MSGASSILQVLACQLSIPATVTADARDAHLRDSVGKVRRRLSEGAVDLVVLPELSSIDYSRDAFANLADLAEPLDGPSFAAWRAVARDFDTHVAYSFPRRADDGYRISLAVVAPTGELVGHYDKLHLAQYGASMEKEYFGAGEHLFVFEVGGFRLAPIICYDIRIPELSRTLAVEHGVDVILHSGAYYRDESFPTWHDFAVSRALENQIYFLSLNRAGEHYGHSIFCPPWIEDDIPPTVFPEHDEAFLRLAVDRAAIVDARTRFSFLRDRRDSYDLPVVGG